MSATRSQADYAHRKFAAQQAAAAHLAQVEEILTDLDHDRLPSVDGMDAIIAAARIAVQLELLKDAAKARMQAA
jgi:hypothetical protein